MINISSSSSKIAVGFVLLIVLLSLSGSALAAGDEITVSRSISKSTVSPGDTFTVTLSLTTNQELVTIGLKELVPSGWNVTEKSSGLFTFSPSGIEWIWTNIMANVPSGTSATVTYDVKVPDNAAAGVYSITGNAMGKNTPANGGTDVNIAVSGDTQITVAVKTDSAPELAAIGNKSVDVNDLLSFTISAADADGDAITYSATGLPNGATLNATTGKFSWTPSTEGTYDVTFTATANGKTDSEKIKITVNDVSPVIEIAASRSLSKSTVSPGETFTVTLNLNTNKELVTVGLKELVPSGWNVTEKNSGSFTFSPSSIEWIWTNILANVPSGTSATVTYDVKVPANAAAGVYSITGHAMGKNTPANGGTDVNVDTSGATQVTVVVKADSAPELAAIGAKSVNENSLLSFTISATDTDGDSITYSATDLPAGATFNAATATFSWTPTFTQAGVYNATFTATANGKNDSEKVKITVNNVDRVPVLAAIGNKSVNVNDLLSFTISAADADGDAIAYSATGLPAGATLNATTGKFSWTPSTAGTYDVTFIATANGKTDSEKIKVTVNDVSPVIEIAASRLLSKSTVSPGETFTVTLNLNTNKELVTVGLKELVPSGWNVTEKDSGSFTFSPSSIEWIWTNILANVPSGTSATVTYDVKVPASAAAGAYSITGNAMGKNTPANGGTDVNVETSGATQVTVVVKADSAPVLAAIGNKSVNVNDLLSFTISAADADGDAIAYSATGLPAGATLNATTGKFSWTPSTAGTYDVTFIATANGKTDSEKVKITVNDVSPVIEIAASRSLSKSTVSPGETFTVTLNLNTNKELVTVGFKELVPSGWNVTEKDSGSFTFSPSSIEWIWTNILANVPSGTSATVTYDVKVPANAAAGAYSITGNAMGKNTPANGGTDVNVDTSGATQVTVVAKSESAPVLAAIGNKSVCVTELLEFIISATDADGDAITYSVTGLPSGATFDSSTCKFCCAPGSVAPGIYDVTFTASSNGKTDSETIKLTIYDEVNNEDQPPVLAAIGDKSVNAKSLLCFTISATDPDGDAVVYSAEGLPSGATLDATTGKFSWTPSCAGTYTVKFIATANGLTDSETITITVIKVNKPPVLSCIGIKSVNEGKSLCFTISAKDSDGDKVKYSATGLPKGAKFDTATGKFSWTPGYSAAGTYKVKFIATANGQTDYETVKITVKNVNKPPVLASIGSKSVNEGKSLSFTISAKDADGDKVKYSATGLPKGAKFDATTGKFTWKPGYTAAGTYKVKFTATANGQTDSETVKITVKNVNRAPVLSCIGSKSVKEGKQLSFTISAKDADGDKVKYSATGLPKGAKLDATTGKFTWKPGYSAAGTYKVKFTATANGQTDSETVKITVKNVK